MKKLVLFIVALGSACLIGGTAFGDIIHVPAVEYPTIQAAIDAASDGDSVLVADGIYTGDGNKNLDFQGKAITVQSENGSDNCIIDCEGDGRGFYFHTGEGENSVISGFTITNGQTDDGESSGSGYDERFGGGISCYQSSPTINNCIITGNSGRLGGGISCYDSSPTINNCTISGNTAPYDGGGILCRFFSSPSIVKCTITGNTTDSWGGGISCSTSSSPTITNCLIIENTGNCGGICCGGFSSPNITNSTISGNKAVIHGGGIHLGHNSSPTFSNCILWNNLPDQINVLSESGASVLVMYSDIQGGYTGVGNIDADPLFVDPENDDYHLTESSPCRDVGTPTGAPIDDIDGDPRPQGAGYDMGADEFLNISPYIPSAPNPSANSINISLDTTLSWTGGAPDPEDTVTYDIYFGTTSTAASVATNYTSTTYDPGTLEYNTTYYWQIVARDNHAAEAEGPVWSFATGALGVTIHVPGNYQTIQAAIDAASDGDTVLVADGTYTGEDNKNLDFNGKAITVQSGNGPANCVIDCQGDGRGFYFHTGEGENSVISGFTIINGQTDDGGPGGAISCYQSSPIITNCIISGNHATNADAGGISCYDSSPTITNCTISGNTAHYNAGGILCSFFSSPTIVKCCIAGNTAGLWGGGISCSTSSSPTITNCLIIENTGNCGGICCGGFSSPNITNSTISGNKAVIHGGGIHLGHNSSPTFSNCILWNNLPDQINVLSESGASVLVMYSDIQGGYTGVGNIDTAPLFVDPENDDYHLTESSPCREVGTPTGAPIDDIDGDPRPQGAGYDMGADEFLNVSPYIPAAPNPSANSINISLDTTLSWTGGAPHPEDTVTYDIYFSTTSTPASAATNYTSTTYDPGTLEYNTTYYWQIVARDNIGAEAEGPVWTFATLKVGNISGQVTTSVAGHPTHVVGARITIVEMGQTATSGADGKYTLTNAPIGTYTVKIEKDDLETLFLSDIEVAEGETTPVAPSEMTVVRCGLRGDINGDGRIGLEEAIHALQIVCSLASTTSIISTFDIDEWTTEGIVNVTYKSSGGNPGGFLFLEDTGGDSYGVKAPNKFYGNLLSFDGGTLSYDVIDIRETQLTSIGSGFGRIQILGGDSHATFDYAPNPPIPSNQTWTTYYAPLKAESWNTTQENWEKVLSDVTSITIVLDLENMGFDNFKIEP